MARAAARVMGYLAFVGGVRVDLRHRLATPARDLAGVRAKSHESWRSSPCEWSGDLAHIVAVLSAGRFGFLGQGQPLLLGVVELGLGGGQPGTDPSQFFVVGGRLECLCEEVSLSGQPVELLVELT